MTPKLPAIRGETTPTISRRGTSASTHVQSDEERGPDWRRIGSALLRFKWIVVLLTALGLAAAFGATRMLHPVYRAQANVWLDVPDRRGDRTPDTRGPIRQAALLDADAWVE